MPRLPAEESSCSPELPPESRHNRRDTAAPPSEPRVHHPNNPQSTSAGESSHKTPAPPPWLRASSRESRDARRPPPSPDAPSPSPLQLAILYAPYRSP